MTTTLQDCCCRADLPDSSSVGGRTPPVVLVYEPQSHATPVREAAASAAAARMARRRKHRGAGCLTEILWDDVQRAKDLLRLSRRRQHQEEHQADASVVFESATPTATAGDDAAAAIDLSATTDASHVPARFRELKQMLCDLMERREDRVQQLARLQAAERSLTASSEDPAWSSANASVSTDGGRLCLPTQYLLAVQPHGSSDCEDANEQLRQLQDAATVQSALVEANGRLLRECRSDRRLSFRRMKRRRTMEFARCQEKLREINSRISEIRTRDLPAQGQQQPAVAEPWASQSSAVQASNSGPMSQSLLNLGQGLVEAQTQLLRQLNRSSSQLTSSTSDSRPRDVISHAGSVDSGFQEIQATTAALLDLDCQLIDQED